MQGDFNLGNVFEDFMAQTKESCFPESHRCDVHVLVATGGFIAVPSNNVNTIPLEIKKDGIKINIGMLLHTLPDLKELDRPVGV